MMKKRSKGFTLVELLVTIALMLSLLGIAIVSFIKMSDNKKKESYELVKEQIMAAGEQYFEDNLYLFEGLEEGSTGIISVGKLVSEDSLNKVTNPVTGRAINYCSKVVVKKINGKIQVEKFEEGDNSKTCDTSNSVMTSEPGAPKIETITFSQAKNLGLKKSDNWFGDKVDATLKIQKESNTVITNVEYCNTTEGLCTDYKKVSDFSSSKDRYTVTNSAAYDAKKQVATTCYRVTGVGKSTQLCDSADVDTKAPSCKTSSSATSWTNKDVTLTGTCTDNESGCKSAKITNKISTIGTTTNSPGKVSDKVGHKASCGMVTTKIDKTAPVCNVSGGNSTWINSKSSNKTVTVRAECKDEDGGSGCKTKPFKQEYSDDMNITNAGAKGVGNGGYVEDMAGNRTKCSSDKTVKIDTNAPTISAKVVEVTKNKKGEEVYTKIKLPSWINKKISDEQDIDVKVAIKDNISKINTISRFSNGANSKKFDEKNGFVADGNGGKQWANRNKEKSDHTVHISNFSDGHRVIKFSACDYAGNCNNDKIVVKAKIDKTKPTVNINLRSNGAALNSGVQSHYNIAFNLTASDGMSGVNKKHYSFNNKSWTNYSSGNVDLIKNTGKQDVWAYVTDKAGNESKVVKANGFCNKDTVEAEQTASGCNFKLGLSLKYDPTGVVSGKYVYAVWKKEATNDTENYDWQNVTQKCGTAPPDSATKITVTNSNTRDISMLAGEPYMYYCFAVRPYREKDPGIGNAKWTVQRKHALTTQNCR